MSDHVLERDSRHRYWCVNPDHKEADCAGKIFESVTTILGKAVPKNLAWYGMTQGVYGVKGLTRLAKYDVRKMSQREMLDAIKAEGISDGVTIHGITPPARTRLSAVPKYDIPRMSPNDITDALKREKLTVNDHRDAAADGGTAMHDALEEWIKRGILPNAAAVPESKRASMRGLARFILDYRPEFVAAEVKTLSVKHGFAGTFDFLANVHAELYTERGKLKLRPAESVLFILGDMKNSRWVYPSSHFPQLEAYEGGRLEAGEPATDVRAVLWLNANGDMELVPSSASFEDFLALKASAEVLGRLDKSWSRPRKARS